MDNAGAPAAQQQQQQQPMSLVGQAFQFLSRAYLIYLAATYFFPASGKGASSSSSMGALSGGGKGSMGPSSNMFQYGSVLDLHVYLSPDPVNEFKTPIVWYEKGIVYGDWNDVRQLHAVLPVTEELAHNGSLYLHAYMTLPGVSPDDLHTQYDLYQGSVLYTKLLLTKYMPPRKSKHLKNLMTFGGEAVTGQSQETAVDAVQVADFDPTQWISYWHTNISLVVLTDETAYPGGRMPEQVAQYLKIHPRTGNYLPYFYVNDFWQLKEDFMPINSTVKQLDLFLDFAPISLMKWQLYTQLEQSFQMQASMGTTSDSETDEIRHILLHTNPWFLGMTMLVSLLHSLFDFLAFKNDIQFWQKRKSMVGISVRTVLLDIFFQSVIFLYLLDNDTSFMILVSTGLGLAIEVWKVTKALDITVTQSANGGILPHVSIKEKASYSKSKTKKHDEEAFKYLAWVVYPLFAGYCIYSLVYETHKNWYSFTLNTLVGFVYIFGFLMMTPQLYINYKQKSVRHMPWKKFMYKALNTFVDDLFAFIIRMPTMHRLAAFRDDIIFFVYLYQLWIYPKKEGAADEDDEEFVEDDDKAPAVAAAETKKDQ